LDRLRLELLRSVGNFVWDKSEDPERRLERKFYFCSLIKRLGSVTKVMEAAAAAVRLSVQAVAAAYTACRRKSILGLQYGQAARSHVHFN